MKNKFVPTVQEVLRGSKTPKIDAELLLAYVLKKPRAFLYTYPEQILNSNELSEFYKLLEQRIEGTPIAYLVGEKEFWSLPLKINANTLIPRPETELLVERTLSLKTNNLLKVLELGTGSGAISLALASEHPDWEIIATDSSQAALSLAQENSYHLKIKNVSFICSNWFQSITPRKFDVIISNPPYLALDDPHLLIGDLRFEPQTALVSGHSGLESLAHIIEKSYEYLTTNGLLLLEHGFDQKDKVIALLSKHGYRNLQSWQDFQGHYRVSGGYR